MRCRQGSSPLPCGAAINVELLKSALVSQAHPEAGARGGAALAGSESCAACTAEGLLVETLEAARRVQEQACGSVAAEQADNWEHVMWEAFACTRKGVGCTLFDLQVLAANLGSAEGALQVAHCLATGMLVPRDEAAALDWCHRAAEMGSPDAALKCGVHHYEGRAGTASSTVFAGRVGSSERGEADEQGALAYDFFSRALELCERAMTEEEQASSGHARATAGEGAEASSEEGGAAFVPSAGLEVVRRSALSWLGRCHLEGRGVPHDVARAAELFRRAENKEELRELAMLKRQFEAVELERESVEQMLERKRQWEVEWGPEAPFRQDIALCLGGRIRVARFYSSVSLLRHIEAPQQQGAAREAADGVAEAGGSEGDADGARGEPLRWTYCLGDSAVMQYDARPEGTALPRVAPLWVYALFEDERDIIDSRGEPGRPDRAALGRAEVFRLCEWAADGSNRILDCNLEGNLNLVMDLLCPATVKQRDTILDLAAYEAQPHHFWYRFSFDSSILRWEWIPPTEAAAGVGGPARVQLPEDQGQRQHGEARTASSAQRGQQALGEEQDARGAAGTDTPLQQEQLREERLLNAGCHARQEVQHQKQQREQQQQDEQEQQQKQTVQEREEEEQQEQQERQVAQQGQQEQPQPWRGQQEQGAPLRVAGPLTMVDLYAGLGTVLAGVECDPQASSSFCANLPLVATPTCSLAQFLADLQAARSGLPRRGEVTHLHASPPCQALSSRNRQRCLRRFKEELVPALDETMEAVEALAPTFLTLEEVPQFLITSLPRDDPLQPPPDAAAREEQEEGWRDSDMLVSPDGTVAVRAWLRVVPRLLLLGYQRVFLIAAKCGYRLPPPPQPQYRDLEASIRGLHLRKLGAVPASGAHTTLIFFASDDRLLTMDGWSSLFLRAPGGGELPEAVTVEEAIGDLPLLLQDAGHESGRACQAYCPRREPMSRYAEFMRRGAGPVLLHHERRPMETGAQPAPPGGLFPTVCGYYNDHKGFGRGLGARNQHYEEPRWFTLAERKRAQSLPDRTQLFGSTLREKGVQVGNAVPYVLARAVAQAVYEASTGRPPPDPTPLLKGYVGKPLHWRPPPQATQQQQQQQQGQDRPESEPGAGPEAGPSQEQPPEQEAAADDAQPCHRMRKRRRRGGREAKQESPEQVLEREVAVRRLVAAAFSSAAAADARRQRRSKKAKHRAPRQAAARGTGMHAASGAWQQEDEEPDGARPDGAAVGGRGGGGSSSKPGGTSRMPKRQRTDSIPGGTSGPSTPTPAAEVQCAPHSGKARAGAQGRCRRHRK
eukprot:scaffold19.g1743.t1